MFIVVIGAVAGWIAGQYMKGSEAGVGIDIAAGVGGACVAVVISRFVGPQGAAGLMMSSIIAILGAVAGLFAMRKFQKAKEVPVARSRRR
jgi:uncharacterized membrane protein YeaQ/YmgE (transglycosylase-associated protein family)